MALGILGIIFAVLVLISALAIFALFFKGGYYVSNTWIFYLIQVFTILLDAMYISSVPDNFIINKVIGGLLICIAIFNAWFKEKNFTISRIISAILICAALGLLFL